MAGARHDEGVPWTSLTQPEAVLFAAAVGATGAIAGGLIAAMVTQLLGGRIQRRRQWDEIRHIAYAKVAETFHAAWGLYDQTGRLRADPATQRRAADDLLAAYSRAALLTRRDSTAEALEHLHDTAQDLWDRRSRSWAEIDEACGLAERTFRQSCRTELGLRKRRGGPPRTPRQALPPPGSAKVSDNVTAKVASAEEEHR